jgi:cobalamin-dependent methionine synthase I
MYIPVFFLQEGKYDEALAVAKKQVENGAQVKLPKS